MQLAYHKAELSGESTLSGGGVEVQVVGGGWLAQIYRNTVYSHWSVDELLTMESEGAYGTQVWKNPVTEILSKLVSWHVNK